MNTIPAEEVYRLFKYQDGKLIWKISRGNIKAGTSPKYKTYQGYEQIRYCGKPVRVHHIVWFMHRGYWPKSLDHINGDKSDNRIENLRECTQEQNTRNRSAQPNNTSGYKGVSFHKTSGKWVAQIKAGRVRKHLGLFKAIEDAATVYNFAAAELHGPFAYYNTVPQTWLEEKEDA